MTEASTSLRAMVLLRVCACLVVMLAVALIFGGAQLWQLGGSAYYFITGVSLFAAGVLLWCRRELGVLLTAATVLGTVVWGVWEVGLDGWALLPRVALLLVLGAVVCFSPIRDALISPVRRRSWLATLVPVVAAIGVGALLHHFTSDLPADPMYAMGTAHWSGTPRPVETTPSGDWLHYGNDQGGTRFSALSQIDPGNVAELELLWTARLGPTDSMQVTPLKIDDTLYVCNSNNDVAALDAETGQQKWRFAAGVDRNKAPHRACRGVAYYRVPERTGTCAERIYTNTLDARLIAIDARDGRRCQDFGTNGEISLRKGMGEVEDGYYYVTSAPTLVSGKLVIGGWIADNQYWGEPAGVVRAFDAVTGAFVWAFDMGRPDRQSEPPEGETYTPATPNAWAPMSADESLDLVFVATGNATPDYFGGYRREFDDAYSSAVVAIEASTGRVRWAFQTVHHDLWDYDVASQPTLVDYPTANGSVPAVIQTTKRGELFVLNRETGEPVVPVEERPVPQTGGVPEDRVHPTQPFTVGLPSFRGPVLDERDMWGITPLDQLWCRIKFREAHYEGHFTPPGLVPTISTPGYMGGSNWGGVSVDVSRSVLVLNTNHVFNYLSLLPRAQADALGLKPFSSDQAGSSHVGGLTPGARTPYGGQSGPFFSPLVAPCNRPPYGRLSAVDLTTGKLLWTQPLGTASESGPLGLRSLLPLPLGTPNSGGSLVTQSGLTFIAAAQDRYLRAFETVSGKLLWQTQLPAAGMATPMTYLSPSSGRQIVVIAAGGHPYIPTARGDYIVAFARPAGSK
ncbi:membrane-bound PQQ-dependent dehydrogenase, glucose/quinate/shikimate family [Steroidobacter sp.]|uniref:membrane-bound PQQ-dependent dehydrogenase, glucose/quinate/shikimate family n=1 Tax=Steroidobacter sp. TaxID=1978227 RepID=UPI001A63EFF7|nr:membrane-bound PQQ-dependent dehydrogenase, glucose/quinate/shikimate family [Steroidobacter sp.]MBL8271760.1 membrane-bound PQQ-dependent dehydrogenase, glucose/quinate/shikimate family [Steroidobacter sp.]